MPLVRSFVKRQGSNCVTCTDPVQPCASCAANEECQQLGQSCSQCAQNVCQAIAGSGGKSSMGGTIGGALGGVLGLLAALGLVYWFWWKPRGLAASQRRYSRHLSNRQSRSLGADKKTPSSPGGAGAGAEGVAKRSSVHLRIDGPDSTLSHRPTTPGHDDTDEPSSAGATGGYSRSNSMTLDLDNPFGDHARSSVGTSDFSFRSSHSTNIIPIAYIPPHSNSMSVQDAQRGAYGEILSESAMNRGDSGRIRQSIPTSLASRDSRDSLVLAGADGITLNPLPPVLTPGSPIIPLSTAGKGGPIRPPRSPGLDLQLPKSSAATSPLASPVTPIDRNSFPWSPPPIPPSSAPGQSHFSLATRSSFLTAGSDGDRGTSVLLEPGRPLNHHLSTVSNLSTATTRSTNSTLSYILDPPQIITPVNAQALRRVEVLGRGQAGLVRLPGSGPPTAAIPSSPPALGTSATSSPSTPKALGGPQTSLFTIQQQAPPRTSADPFADDNAAVEIPSPDPRFSVGGMTASPNEALGHSRTMSNETVRTSDVASPIEAEYESGNDRWTISSVGSVDAEADIVTATLLQPMAFRVGHGQSGDEASFDMPQSARNSAVETGSRPRSLTGGSVGTLDATRARSNSRTSFTSSIGSRGTDSISMLDGIPFLAPGGSSPTQSLNPGFPLPPPRSPSLGAPPSPSASFTTSSYGPQSDHRGSQYSYDTSYSDASFAPPPPPPAAPPITDEDDSPLPAPFLPFAGQRPSSNFSSARTNSQAISVRSGFGSGLSQIPFQLGFPSGLDGASERGSMMTYDSRMDGGRDSLMSYQGGHRGGRDDDQEDMLSGVEEQTEPDSSRPGSSLSSAGFSEDTVRAMPSLDDMISRARPTSAITNGDEDSDDNPFGKHAEIGLERGELDPRLSTDSMAIALSQELERSLGLDD